MSCEVRQLFTTAINLFSCEGLCIHKETALKYIMSIYLIRMAITYWVITGKVK